MMLNTKTIQSVSCSGMTTFRNSVFLRSNNRRVLWRDVLLDVRLWRRWEPKHKEDENYQALMDVVSLGCYTSSVNKVRNQVTDVSSTLKWVFLKGKKKLSKTWKDYMRGLFLIWYINIDGDYADVLRVWERDWLHLNQLHDCFLLHQFVDTVYRSYYKYTQMGLYVIYSR
jgi:hypothetical protein